MNNKRANQLEEALERAARGETVEGPLDPLMRTAQQLSILAEPPPPAPYKLAPGRQRYMVKVAEMRARKASRRRAQRPMLGAAKWVSALTVAVLLLSLFLGAGQAMADSLPGEPLYALKLGIIEQRLRWTDDPQARMDLALDTVDERLTEIAEVVQAGEGIDQATGSMLQKHLGLALGTIDQEVEPLQTQHQATIMAWEQRMLQLMQGLSDAEKEPLQLMAQETRRIRFELHSGNAEMAGEQNMNRTGQPDAPDAEAVDEATVGQGAGTQAGNDDRPNALYTGPKPEETPTGLNAPVRPGPGPGQLGSDEKEGDGPVQAQPTPSGPTYNWLRKNAGDTSSFSWRLYQPATSSSGTGGTGTGGSSGSGQGKP